MDKFRIKGGVSLKGRVRVSGAKNASLPIMAACLLTEGVSVVKNVPNVRDVWTMKAVLEHIGCNVEFHTDEHTLVIDATNVCNFDAPYELVKQMRASYYVLGPLLARFHKARVSLPGGCAIGARPVDLHIRGLRALGACVDIEHGYIDAKAETLKGEYIFLEGARGPSVGATINVMMCAVLADGETVIEGAAREPEVSDVANFLRKMGAKIEGDGTSVIRIQGVKGLSPAEYSVIPDRIEAGTYILAGAITKGEIEIVGLRPEHLTAFLDKLKEAGVRLDVGNDNVCVYPTDELLSVDVKIAPYPGFPTDLQAQMMALMCVSRGISVISETIFENRFMHVPELQRLGADITLDGHNAIVKGVGHLSGAPVMASDLRASAALVLAGLVADGETEVLRVYHIDRGYEGIEEKLNALGARIERVRG